MSGQNRVRRFLTVLVLLRLARSYKHHGQVMYQGDQIANTIKQLALGLRVEEFEVDRQTKNLLAAMRDDDEMKAVIRSMFDMKVEESNDV